MELKNICFSYGKKVVYDNLNLSVPDKKITKIRIPEDPLKCIQTLLENLFTVGYE